MPIAKPIKKIDLPNLEKYFAGTKKGAINLTIGEPDFDLDERVLKKLYNAKSTNFRYSSSRGNEALRVQIAQKINNECRTKLDPCNVLVTTGSSQSLFLALQSIINPGDEVVIFEPYFPPYVELVKILGGKPVIISTFPDFIPDIFLIEKSISKNTKAIIVNSPNNPTGVIYSREFIFELVKIARKNNLYIISDEVYKDFDYEKKFLSPAEYYPKTIIVNSFSKSHAATGLRIGFLCAPIQIIESANKLLFLEQVCVPEFIQSAFVGNLNIDQKRIGLYRKICNQVATNLGKSIDFVKPDGGFYFFLKIHSIDTKLVSELAGKGVLTMPGSIFCTKKNYIRISMITDEKKLLRAIKIISKTAAKCSSYKSSSLIS